MEVLDLFRRARDVLFLDSPSSKANDNLISVELAAECSGRTILRLRSTGPDPFCNRLEFRDSSEVQKVYRSRASL